MKEVKKAQKKETKNRLSENNYSCSAEVFAIIVKKPKDKTQVSKHKSCVFKANTRSLC